MCCASHNSLENLPAGLEARNSPTFANAIRSTYPTKRACIIPEYNYLLGYFLGRGLGEGNLRVLVLEFRLQFSILCVVTTYIIRLSHISYASICRTGCVRKRQEITGTLAQSSKRLESKILRLFSHTSIEEDFFDCFTGSVAGRL